MQFESGVYKIVNTIDGRYYIGSTERDFREREMSHWNCLRRGKHHNYKLQIDWNKLGESVFKFEIVERVSPNKAKKREQWYLDNKTGDYNLSKLSEGRITYRLSKDQCIEMLDDYAVGNFKLKELAERYDTTEYTINNIVSGRSYLKYNLDPVKIAKSKDIARNRKKGDEFRNVSFEQLGKIRFLAEKGIPLIHIGNELGLYKNAIRNYKAKNFLGVSPIEDLDTLNRIRSKQNYTVIVKYDNIGEEVGRFETAKEAGKSVGKSLTTILDYVNGERKDPKGFIWKKIKL
jgi:group I intron endonuclease